MQSSPPSLVEAVGLTKRFGRREVVAGVDLAIPRGCAFGLLGHNGAGKTTVMRMLVGLIRPDAGSIRLAGYPVLDRPADALARVGAVIEEPRFHGDLSGRENLRVVAAVRGPAAMARIDSVLARVGLVDRAGDRVRTYSQGMRQRLGIARCLLPDPELLILDEPTNGLDPTSILGLRRLIDDLVAEDRTVILSSHLLDEVERVCHAAAVIDGGRVIAQGPVHELLGGRRTIFDLSCSDPQAALVVVRDQPAVVRADPSAAGVRLELRHEAAIGEVNAALVTAGIPVQGISPAGASLEERFLHATSSARRQA